MVKHTTIPSVFFRIVFGVACVFVGLQTNSFADEPSLPDQPKDYAAKLDSKLPAGWRCTYDFRTLVVSYDKEVTFLNILSLPPFEQDAKFYQEYGVRGNYLIVMKFVSKLNEKDQRSLFERRRKTVASAVEGRKKEKYTGGDVYCQHFVPEYFNERFSIDLKTSDFWPLELVAPADVVVQKNEILKILKTHMQVYPIPDRDEEKVPEAKTKLTK